MHKSLDFYRATYNFIISFFLNLLSGSSSDIEGLFLSLLLGTPLFSLIGMPIAAITLGASSRGALLIFYQFPFFCL